MNYCQTLNHIKYISFFFLGSKKSKVQKDINVSKEQQQVSSYNQLNNITGEYDRKFNNISILCIANNLYSKKPTFNELTKTLHIFAEKDIIIKPRELKIIHTDEKFYFSEYLYNFGTTSNKYMGTFLLIQFLIV